MQTAHGRGNPADVFSRPTADEIWLGPTQASALGRLSNRDRTAGMAGAPATGRTALLERLAHDAARSGALVLTADATGTGLRGLLSALLSGAGLNASHLGPVDQRNLLHLVVNERLRSGRDVLICVDDADTLEPDVAEEVGRLLHFAPSDSDGLMLRFAFDPQTPNPALEAQFGLSERVAYLSPLRDDEVLAYFNWRFDRAGLTNPLTETAMLLTARFAQRRFRGIDSLARLALLLMQRRSHARIDVQTIRDAAALLRHQHSHTRRCLDSDEEAKSLIGDASELGRIIVTEHGVPVTTVPLASRLLIGRGPTNEIRISGTAVSRHHAMIEVVDGRVQVVDLNSANGLQVNGSVCRHAALKNNDVVSIGAFKLKLECKALAGAKGKPGVLQPDTVVLNHSVTSPRTHLKSV